MDHPEAKIGCNSTHIPTNFDDLKIFFQHTLNDIDGRNQTKLKQLGTIFSEESEQLTKNINEEVRKFGLSSGHGINQHQLFYEWRRMLMRRLKDHQKAVRAQLLDAQEAGVAQLRETCERTLGASSPLNQEKAVQEALAYLESPAYASLVESSQAEVPYDSFFDDREGQNTSLEDYVKDIEKGKLESPPEVAIFSETQNKTTAGSDQTLEESSESKGQGGFLADSKDQDGFRDDDMKKTQESQLELITFSNIQNMNAAESDQTSDEGSDMNDQARFLGSRFDSQGNLEEEMDDLQSTGFNSVLDPEDDDISAAVQGAVRRATARFSLGGTGFNSILDPEDDDNLQGTGFNSVLDPEDDDISSAVEGAVQRATARVSLGGTGFNSILNPEDDNNLQGTGFNSVLHPEDDDISSAVEGAVQRATARVSLDGFQNSGGYNSVPDPEDEETGQSSPRSPRAMVSGKETLDSFDDNDRESVFVPISFVTDGKVEFSDSESSDSSMTSSDEDTGKVQKEDDILEAFGEINQFLSARRARNQLSCPQKRTFLPSTWPVRCIALANVTLSMVYIWWRIMFSLKDNNFPIYSIVFLGGEIIWIVALIITHASRIFPVARVRLTMDELVLKENSLESTKVAILLPTNGEKLRTLLAALFGIFSQQPWTFESRKQGACVRDQIRLVVLDDANRPEVLKLVNLVYHFSEIIQKPKLKETLILAGVQASNVQAVYDFLDKNRHRPGLEVAEALSLSKEIKNHLKEFDDKFKMLNKGLFNHKKNKVGQEDSINPMNELKKELIHNQQLPYTFYEARDKDESRSARNPKAQNLNHALFPSKDGKPPFIGQAQYVVIHDAKHCLKSQYLQRVLPYFYKAEVIESSKPDRDDSHGPKMKYSQSKVGVVHVAHHFPEIPAVKQDRLGMKQATWFDITCVGRDGVGGSVPVGHGSIWRMNALCGIKPGKSLSKHEFKIGEKIGFLDKTLCSEVHTCFQLFNLGWESAFVHECGEVLSICIEQPDTVSKRFTQFLRYSAGHMQLLFYYGYRLWLQRYPASAWHRVYALEHTTWFFKAVAYQAFIFLPFAFAEYEDWPMNTHGVTFAAFFIPFFITIMTPTAIGIHWKNSKADAIMRDEQLQVSMAYGQICIFWMILWKALRSSSKNIRSIGWNPKLTTIPIYVTFFSIFFTLVGESVKWTNRSFELPVVWLCELFLVFLFMHLFWPLCSHGLQIVFPPAFYTRAFGMFLIMLTVSFWLFCSDPSSAT